MTNKLNLKAIMRFTIFISKWLCVVFLVAIWTYLSHVSYISIDAGFILASVSVIIAIIANNAYPLVSYYNNVITRIIGNLNLNKSHNHNTNYECYEIFVKPMQLIFCIMLYMFRKPITAIADCQVYYQLWLEFALIVLLADVWKIANVNSPL